MLDKTLFQSFNNKNTTTEKQRDKEQKYQKGRRKLENNILVGYSLLDTLTENYKEQYTNKKKGDKRIEIEMVTYCLPCWLLWTPTTLKDHY